MPVTMDRWCLDCRKQNQIRFEHGGPLHLQKILSHGLSKSLPTDSFPFVRIWHLVNDCSAHLVWFSRNYETELETRHWSHSQSWRCIFVTNTHSLLMLRHAWSITLEWRPRKMPLMPKLNYPRYRCGPRVAEHDSWLFVLSNTTCATRYLAMRYLTLPAIFWYFEYH